MVVRVPADARRFNGIVVVEWLNVTALAEGAADFMQMQELLLRDGYAWVGVGAQAAGVNSPRSGLKDWDKTRYGSLVHPGDAYSYDIFSQAARAVRESKTPDVLGGVTVRKVIATGRSQSAFRLVTYINAVHPVTHLFDGYLVHSRGANASGFKAEGLARDTDNPVPPGAHIRTDIDVPVLDLQTEGDMVALRAHLTHQPSFDRYRRWEIAGAAHAETPRWVAEAPPPLDMGQGCKDPVNSAPHHAVVKAALAAMTLWVRMARCRHSLHRSSWGTTPPRIRCCAMNAALRRAGSVCPRSRRRLRRSTAAPTPALRSQRPARRAISASCSAERGCSTTRR